MRFFQEDFEQAAEMIADSIEEDSYLSDDSSDYVDAHLRVLELMVRKRISTLADGTIEDSEADVSQWTDEAIEEFFTEISAYEGPMKHLIVCGFTPDQVSRFLGAW